MDTKNLQEIIQSEIASSHEFDQYNVTSIPYHVHNGLDSPTLLSARYVLYRIVAAETTVTVASSVGGAIPIPFSGTIQTVGATVDTAGTTGSMLVDVLKNGVSILSTPITIASGSTTSRSNTVQPVVIPASSFFSVGDLFTFSVTQVQTTPAKGLVIFMVLKTNLI